MTTIHTESKLTIFIVRGASRFPFDMLRHGQCWPQQNPDVEKMSEPCKLREITLESVAFPCVRRWQSFGWKVIEVNGDSNF